MEKKNFLDSLNQMRKGEGNFKVANNLHYVIKDFPELADCIINDLSVSICIYLGGETSDDVMAAEYSLYCFRKVLEMFPQKAAAVFSIMKEMAKVSIIYDGSAAGICVKVMNEIGKEYATSPTLMTDYMDILAMLRKSNSWADEFIK